MRPAFPASEYYDGSATPQTHQPTSRLTGRHQRPLASGMLPTFTIIRLTGSTVGYTPAACPGSNRSTSPASKPRSMNRAWSGMPKHDGITVTAHDPSVRFQVVRCVQEASTTVSLSLCLSVSLARTRVSGSATRPLRCRGCSHRQHAIPCHGCPQLHRTAASARGRHFGRHG